MKPQRLEGLIAAPPTPMHADGSVSPGMIEGQCRALAEAGVRGAFVCGTTGEGLSLTVPERMQVAEAWVTAAGEDLAVIVHAGHLSLAEGRALAAHAQRIGADAVAAMGPCFFKPDTVGDLVEFCAELASAAPELPFYYYHIPAVSGVLFPMIEFLQCASGRIPTLAGMKYTHEDLMDFGRCLRFQGGRHNMLFGRDEILLCALALGARGAVGTTYNFAAPLYLRIMRAFEAGDMATAREDQARAMEMVAVLRTFGVTIAAKEAMKLTGLDCGPVRPPLRDLTGAESARLRDELDRAGFFDYASHAARA